MDALTRHDRERFLSFFADDCLHEDPESGGPCIGKDGISRRWDEMQIDGRAFTLRAAGVFPSGPETAVHWIIEEEQPDGERAIGNGVDIVGFAESGAISSIYAYWQDPTPESLPALKVAQQYVDAMNARSRERVLSLWSDEGVRQDRMGAPPRIGIDAIGEAFDRIMERHPDFTITIEALCAARSEVAMVWRTEFRGSAEAEVIRGVDVLSVDASGALCALHSYTEADLLAGNTTQTV
jgi:ketosteroid isomerase-like protein